MVMAMDHSFHASVIAAFGGKAKLALALGLPRKSICKWHTRGIPPRYWHKVAELSPVPLTAEQLEQTKPNGKG